MHQNKTFDINHHFDQKNLLLVDSLSYLITILKMNQTKLFLIYEYDGVV